MTIRKLVYAGAESDSHGTTNPSLTWLRNGMPARRMPLGSVAQEQDQVLANTCRCLLSVGMHGAHHLQILSETVPTDTQLYPDKTRVTVVARRPAIRLTPGCFPTVVGLALPCGPTTKFFFSTDQWILDAAIGSVEITAEYYNEVTLDSATVTDTYKFAPSGNPSNKETLTAGGAWAELIPFGGVGWLAAGTIKQRFSDHSTVALTVRYKGAPRILDLAVYEVPIVYEVNTMIDDPEWAIPIAGNNAFPSQYPLEELSASDPWYGSQLMADSASRQQRELGPLLMEWSAWSESEVAVTDTECRGINITSTSFVDLRDSSLASWSAANPGWSVSSGGTAQQFGTSNHLVEMLGKDACVPVRCWVWGSRSGAGTSTVRFQTQAYSICQVLITSSTPGWVWATGHIRCGLGAEDASVLQILAKASFGSTLNIQHVCVEYLDT